MTSSIHSLSKPELTALCEDLGEPAFRGKQLWDWLYGKRVKAWDEMRNVPLALRTKLAEGHTLYSTKLLSNQASHDETRKLLVELHDKDCIEEVIIPAKGRLTVCVSTQVGCGFRCKFCASGQTGAIRDLDAGEIVEEVLHAGHHAGLAPTHVVFMGIGEPFDNYEAVLRAVRTFNDPDGLNIGARRMTLSTSGVVPGIKRLGDEGLQVELSVSLHAANNEVRNKLMPVNRKYDIDELLDACRRYVEKTGRLITFEYTLVKGVNDSQGQARELAARLKVFPCRINLIPLNPIEEFNALPSDRGTIDSFMEILSRAGINATLRLNRGRGVDGACGQLRSRHVKARSHAGL